MNQAAPLALSNSQKSKELMIRWADNDVQVFTHQGLRGACPCAKCRAARIQGLLSLVNEDVELVAINPMGYGVQLVFSDGHDRGIFPWSYFRDLGKSSH